MSLELSLLQYLEQAASDSPTPGGGSVAALVGALGTCMASMAANFTLGRKKYAAVEGEIRHLLERLGGYRAALLEAMEEDEKAFLAVGEAYRMPHTTEEETKVRDQAIQAALRGAMRPPREVMRVVVETLELLPRLAEIGNPNLISDTGVAAILLEAAGRAARLNLDINLRSLTDPNEVERLRKEAEDRQERAALLNQQTLSRVHKQIGMG